MKKKTQNQQKVNYFEQRFNPPQQQRTIQRNACIQSFKLQIPSYKQSKTIFMEQLEKNTQQFIDNVNSYNLSQNNIESGFKENEALNQAYFYDIKDDELVQQQNGTKQGFSRQSNILQDLGASKTKSNTQSSQRQNQEIYIKDFKRANNQIINEFESALFLQNFDQKEMQKLPIVVSNINENAFIKDYNSNQKFQQYGEWKEKFQEMNIDNKLLKSYKHQKYCSEIEQRLQQNDRIKQKVVKIKHIKLPKLFYDVSDYKNYKYKFTIQNLVSERTQKLQRDRLNRLSEKMKNSQFKYRKLFKKKYNINKPSFHIEEMASLISLNNSFDNSRTQNYKTISKHINKGIIMPQEISGIFSKHLSHNQYKKIILGKNQQQNVQKQQDQLQQNKVKFIQGKLNQSKSQVQNLQKLKTEIVQEDEYKQNLEFQNISEINKNSSLNMQAQTQIGRSNIDQTQIIDKEEQQQNLSNILQQSDIQSNAVINPYSRFINLSSEAQQYYDLSSQNQKTFQSLESQEKQRYIKQLLGQSKVEKNLILLRRLRQEDKNLISKIKTDKKKILQKFSPIHLKQELLIKKPYGQPSPLKIEESILKDESLLNFDSETENQEIHESKQLQWNNKLIKDIIDKMKRFRLKEKIIKNEKSRSIGIHQAKSLNLVKEYLDLWRKSILEFDQQLNEIQDEVLTSEIVISNKIKGLDNTRISVQELIEGNKFIILKVLKQNHEIFQKNDDFINNRILLALGVKPQQDYSKISWGVYIEFKKIVINRDATLNENLKFLTRFFEPNKAQKEINAQQFLRIIRGMTIKIDENENMEFKNQKALYDLLVENFKIGKLFLGEEQDEKIKLSDLKQIFLQQVLNLDTFLDIIFIPF